MSGTLTTASNHFETPSGAFDRPIRHLDKPPGTLAMLSRSLETPSDPLNMSSDALGEACCALCDLTGTLPIEYRGVPMLRWTLAC